jgi:hypothetical protein
MRPQRFSLKPFPGEDAPGGVTIGGTIARTTGLLSVRFDLRGNLRAVSIPPRSGPAQRRDRLWEESCFELFAGTQESEGYLECNLSPAGHWNAYRFARYREGMREEKSVPSLPFRLWSGPNALRISIDLTIGRIFPPEETLRVGVAAVLRDTAGGLSHWALRHPRATPDFHDRDGFSLTLPP